MQVEIHPTPQQRMSMIRDARDVQYANQGHGSEKIGHKPSPLELSRLFQDPRIEVFTARDSQNRPIQSWLVVDQSNFDALPDHPSGQHYFTIARPAKPPMLPYFSGLNDRQSNFSQIAQSAKTGNKYEYQNWQKRPPVAQLNQASAQAISEAISDNRHAILLSAIHHNDAEQQQIEASNHLHDALASRFLVITYVHQGRRLIGDVDQTPEHETPGTPAHTLQSRAIDSEVSGLEHIWAMHILGFIPLSTLSNKDVGIDPDDPNLLYLGYPDNQVFTMRRVSQSTLNDEEKAQIAAELMEVEQERFGANTTNPSDRIFRSPVNELWGEQAFRFLLSSNPKEIEIFLYRHNRRLVGMYAQVLPPGHSNHELMQALTYADLSKLPHNNKGIHVLNIVKRSDAPSFGSLYPIMTSFAMGPHATNHKGIVYNAVTSGKDGVTGYLGQMLQNLGGEFTSMIPYLTETFLLKE